MTTDMELTNEEALSLENLQLRRQLLQAQTKEIDHGINNVLNQIAARYGLPGDRIIVDLKTRTILEAPSKTEDEP